MEIIKSFIGGVNRASPDYIKYLNVYRNVKGRYDLMLFLYKWDPDYRKDLIVTFLAIGLFCYSTVTWSGFYDMLAMIIEAVIIMTELGGDLSILPADYRPKHGGMIYTVENSTHVLYGEDSFPMSEIRPAAAEAKLGFSNRIEDIKTCKDSSLKSDMVDDALILRDLIMYREEKSETNYISSRHQLRYIAIRVANKKQHTTNGKLLGFHDLANSIVKNDYVTIRKAFYYDALLTMEAFRSRIFRGNLQGEKEVYTDLTTYFPVKKDVEDGKNILRFKPDFYRQVCDLIGITSLILTENKKVAMLYQGSGKVIGSNTVCFGGSGSLNYSDIKASGQPKDFRDILRYGLAREVCEETGMLKYFDEVLSNTMVTGFFRWVDRCGLPEFVGITRAGSVPFSAERSIDGDEVVKYDEVPIIINSPDDFKKVLTYIKENNINVTLSSLMALHRMVVIADYNKDGATAEQKQIYKKMSDFIDGK